MRITEKLDLAIKLNEEGRTDGGYAISYNGKKILKPTYMTNDEWNNFLNNMSDDARKEFESGDGGELTEKNGRPPKMASYGSSSRLIYNLSYRKEGFHFEKKLPTTIGGKANLDGFYEDYNRYIFVEAKCHEPYTSKRNVVSIAYKDLYEYINKRMIGIINIEMNPSTCGRYLNVDYYAEGERLIHFDMKQMICHLLGIATGILKGKLKPKQMDFLYLLFDPTELKIENQAKTVINEIYERTCYECNLIDFVELFRVILDYLRMEKYINIISDYEVDAIVMMFTFTLASQEFYPILLS